MGVLKEEAGFDKNYGEQGVQAVGHAAEAVDKEEVGFDKKHCEHGAKEVGHEAHSMVATRQLLRWFAR